MANSPAYGMKCFAFHCGNDSASNAAVVDAWEAVRTKKPTKFDVPCQEIGSPTGAGSCVLGDMPMMWCPDSQRTLQSCIDLIDDVDEPAGGWDFKEIERLLRAGNYNDLVEPLKTPEHRQFILDMNPRMYKKDHGKWVVLKYFVFRRSEKVGRTKELLIKGLLCVPHWVQDTVNAKKAFQYLFERLPGIAWIRWEWPGHAVKSSAKTNLDKEKRHKGYEFIEKFGPKANNKNQFMIWTEDQVLDIDSAIHGWPEAKVKEALANFAKGKSGAERIEDWPLTF